MEAVQRASLEKAGNGGTAPLDEKSPESFVMERPHERRGIEPVRGHGQLEHVALDAGAGTGGTGRHAAHDHRAGRAIREDVPAAVETTFGVKNHPGRVVSLDLAHGQTWVVRRDRASSHDDSIDKSPEPVEPPDIGWSRDVVRMTRCGGDTAVDALARLGDDQVRLAMNREKEIQQISPLAGDGIGGCPLTRRVDLQPDI